MYLILKTEKLTFVQIADGEQGLFTDSQVVQQGQSKVIHISFGQIRILLSFMQRIHIGNGAGPKIIHQMT